MVDPGTCCVRVEQFGVRPQNIATVALKNLSEDKPRRKRLGELGVVPVLTAVIKSTKNAHTKDAATIALRNVTAEGGGDASVSAGRSSGFDGLGMVTECGCLSHVRMRLSLMLVWTCWFV
jgi:hypothetical protein